MGRLNKDAWAKASLKTDEVEVEELGGTVRIRELPAAYSAAVQEHVTMKTVGNEQFGSVDLVTQERLKFTYAVIDDDGEQMFTEDEVRDLAQNHGRAFRTVLEAVDNLSGLTEEDAAKSADRFQAGRVGTPNGREAGIPEAPAGSDGPAVPARAGA